MSVQHSNIVSLDLDLSGSPELSGQNFEPCFSSTLKPKLQNLSLRLIQISESHLDAIVPSSPKLQNLTLSQAKPGPLPISASAVNTLFQTCPGFRRLRLVTDEAEKLASDLMAELDLKQLDVALDGKAVIIEKRDMREHSKSSTP